MEKIINIPNHYSFMDHEIYDFDRALSIYDWDIKSAEVIVDMTKCLTANYQALSLVVLYLWHLRANDCHISVRFREDKKGASQMWRWMGAMGWSQVLNNEQQNFRGTPTKPLVAIRSKTDFETALAKVKTYTEGFNIEYEKTLRYVISELLYNTLEHGKRFRKIGHLERRIPSIMEFTWYKLRNELQFIIADLGIGIKEHLEQYYDPFGSHEEAIRKALRPQASGTFGQNDPYTNKDNAGVGLYISSNIVKRMNADMHIVSGNGLVHISPVDISGRTLDKAWPGTFVLIKVRLDQISDLNLDSLMGEFREAAHKEASTIETEKASNRLLIVVEHFFGRYAEDKEAAIGYRDRHILPALARGDSLLIDFKNVQASPHSFLSALLATPVKRLGMEAYKKIKVVNAAQDIRETIDFIMDENTST